MSKDELEKEAEEINITYENNVFHCTKNGTKWISIDGEKWYGEEKRIEELEKENHLLGERCNQLLKDKGELTDKIADIKANCDLAIEGRDIKIMELEKENERLKGDLELWESGGCRATNLFECGVVKELKEKIEVLECDNYNANCNLNLITDHLTKSIEIIKGLKSLIEDVCDINYLSKNNTKLLEETEQFLKECK